MVLEETSDRLSRWNGRWSENNLGWHIETPHESLVQYGARIIKGENSNNEKESSCPAAGSLRWLVPLCGKTKDMAYLAKQETTAQVVGVDGIRKALDEFAKEHEDLDIQATEKPSEKFDKLSGKNIDLLKGDFFALDETSAGGKVDAVMDRASMVAIDPSLRQDYVSVIANMIKPGGKILLVTFDRRAGDEEARKKGPPFSIDEAEVRRLYEWQDWVESVEVLHEVDEFEKDPSKKERYDGLTSLYEIWFLITAKK